MAASRARHPNLGQLQDDFVQFVITQDEGAQVSRHLTSTTVVLGDGRRAGVRLKPLLGAFELAAFRGETRLRRLVRRQSDFEAALAWLRELPLPGTRQR
jgi:hypothetical protein